MRRLSGHIAGIFNAEDFDVAARIAEARDTTKRYVLLCRFTMDEHGLTVEVTKGHGQSAVTEAIWICAPFEILGRVRDPNGSGWARLIQWYDRDGQLHEFAVADAALHGDIAALAARIAGHGLSVARTGHKHLADYLNQAEVDARLTQVRSTGWYSIHGNPCFVLPDAVIGAPARERVILENAHNSLYGRQGGLDEARGSIGALVAPYSRGRLAVSIAFARPSLYLLSAEGGGIHLVGQSSRGKTTLQRASASIWGRSAADAGFIRSWRATANAQEGAAHLVSDTLLALNEVGVAEAKDTFTAIYQLAAGSAKAVCSGTAAGARPAYLVRDDPANRRGAIGDEDRRGSWPQDLCRSERSHARLPGRFRPWRRRVRQCRFA